MEWGSCGMSTFDVTLCPLGWWDLTSLGCVGCRLWLTGVQGPACGTGTALSCGMSGMSLSGLVPGEGAGSHALGPQGAPTAAQLRCEPRSKPFLQVGCAGGPTCGFSPV